jgi:protein tyrosine phosphatase type 4A
MNVYEIKTKEINFIMTECPTEKNINIFIDILKTNNVTYLIRIINDLYDTTFLHKEIPNLVVKNLYFTDGDYPPIEIINEYNLFINDLIKKDNGIKPCIAIHCVSSLGRAPCIIALQLINEKIFNERHLIIEFIRNKRRGAFNTKQLKWVLDYKPQQKKQPKFWIRLSKIFLFSVSV